MLGAAVGVRAGDGDGTGVRAPSLQAPQATSTLEQRYNGR